MPPRQRSKIRAMNSVDFKTYAMTACLILASATAYAQDDVNPEHNPWLDIPESTADTAHIRPPKETWDDIKDSGSDDVATVDVASEKEARQRLAEETNWDEIESSGTQKSEKTLAFSKTMTDRDKTAFNAKGDPHKKSQTWLFGDPSTQLEHEDTLPSIMTGGIFVPTMTGGINEPKYLIKDSSGKEVAESNTGSTVYVMPGKYTVEVGSVGAQDRLEFDVNVVDGDVTVVPVEWSGLTIKVVNDRGATIRGNYEIITMPERGYVGLGSGALINEGERLNTWLLWPGQYMIISAGEGYQARKNFITVRLSPGELTYVTLVMDEDTGDILGGGEIDETFEDAEARWWWASVLLGGSIRFNHTRDVVGKADGKLLDVSGFVEAYFSMNRSKHYLYTRLNAEIGGTIRFEEDRPFITTIDELNFELLYTYHVVDWFGPFARFAFESNMAPAYQELTTPHDIERRDKNGNIVSHKENALDVKLSPAFSPITLNAGAGGRFDYSLGSWLKLNARIGIAFRKVFARDLYIISTVDNDENFVIVDPIDGTSQFGIEGAINLDITPIRWFTLKTDFSLIDPFDDYKNPVIDLDLDAAIRLSSIASISYTLRLNYDVSMIDKVQIDQYIQLRFSYKVF